MTDAEVLRRLQASLRNAACHGPVDVKTIEQAEVVLGAAFPRSYRIFLAAFGACYAGLPFEIAGLTAGEFKSANQPPEWSSVVQNTLRARRDSRGKLPASYVAISDDGCDIKFYLDTSRTSIDGECPVVALGPGRDKEVHAQSFLSFLEGEA